MVIAQVFSYIECTFYVLHIGQSPTAGLGTLCPEKLADVEATYVAEQNRMYMSVCIWVIDRWIEACIGEEIPASVELEEGLRNGVVLAKLAHFITPEKVPLRKVYDKDLSRYNVSSRLTFCMFELWLSFPRTASMYMSQLHFRSHRRDAVFQFINLYTALVTIAQCNTLVARCSRQLIGPADWVFVTLGPLHCD